MPVNKNPHQPYNMRCNVTDMFGHVWMCNRTESPSLDIHAKYVWMSIGLALELIHIPGIYLHVVCVQLLCMGGIWKSSVYDADLRFVEPVYTPNKYWFAEKQRYISYLWILILKLYSQLVYVFFLCVFYIADWRRWRWYVEKGWVSRYILHMCLNL